MGEFSTRDLAVLIARHLNADGAKAFPLPKSGENPDSVDVKVEKDNQRWIVRVYPSVGPHQE